MQKYKKIIELDKNFSFSEVAPYYEKMLVCILDTMMERMKISSGAFIDTKLNLITGKNFEKLDDPSVDFKSNRNVFGWIQGRGLESLVGHSKWLKNVSILNEEEKENRVIALEDLIRNLALTLEMIRSKNQGHLFFTFDQNGNFFRINDSGKKEFFEKEDDSHTMTDLFYSKGFGAAAKLLGDVSLQEESKAYLKRILDDIDSGLFQGDQVSFDPKNKVKGTPGVQGQGVRMIAIGALALFAELYQDEYWYDKGCEYICYVFEKFCNLNKQFGTLELYDYSERIVTATGQPYVDEGSVLSDPGHSLEFVGLALKLLLQIQAKKTHTPMQKKALDLASEHFLPMFLHCFEYGYSEVGGIIKAFDLVSRKPINDDMPWWNLPETMRAGAELMAFLPNEDNAEVKKVIAKCSNAFVKNYVNENVHMMAYQTIDKVGKPVDIIPATPDADPGYHTGLSIIDFLRYAK